MDKATEEHLRRRIADGTMSASNPAHYLRSGRFLAFQIQLQKARNVEDPRRKSQRPGA